MPTLLMMCSTQIYELIRKMCDFECYQAPGSIEIEDKPTYYNFNNVPLEEIIDKRTGQPINPEEINIINGPEYYNDYERELMFHNYAKEMFCQWIEIGVHNPTERKEHISDTVWELMHQSPNDDPPSPTPDRGSVPLHYALACAFRVVPCPLLTNKAKWYILHDSGDVDHPDPTPEPEPEPEPPPVPSDPLRGTLLR